MLEPAVSTEFLRNYARISCK